MKRGFVRFAWLVLAVNIAVVLWGAVVRATGAGAGCGEHWPLCNGAAIPPSPQVKTLIEYGHRLTSGVALLLVAGLLIAAFRLFPKGNAVRRAAGCALFFELSEALIGAGLVLLGHVAGNTSVYRGLSLAVHLTNTFLLLASLALTAWFARGDIRLRPAGSVLRPWLITAAAGILIAGISGAIAALGDTLFGSSTLAEGMRQDFSSSAHLFVRLRILHPILACALAIVVFGISVYALMRDGSSASKRLATLLLTITVGQLCLGITNLVLLAPVPVQIAHLFLADLLWIAFVLLASEILAPLEELSGTGTARVERGTVVA